MIPKFFVIVVVVVFFLFFFCLEIARVWRSIRTGGSLSH